jgi:hypothetical protein
MLYQEKSGNPAFQAKNRANLGQLDLEGDGLQRIRHDLLSAFEAKSQTSLSEVKKKKKKAKREMVRDSG